MSRATLTFAAPIDFPASFAIFRRSGDDLLDRWDGATLMRTARINGKSLAYAARVTGSPDRPALLIEAEDDAMSEAVVAAVADSFAPLRDEFVSLRETDTVVGRLARLHAGFRPVLHPDLFLALVRCISAQQVNLRWAATVRRRLAERFGDRHTVGALEVYSLNAERIAAADISEIRELQFTTRKAEYIINVAQAIISGTLDLEVLRAMSDEDVIGRITAVRGLGVWSAEWILARTLGRARVSAFDLGVRKAVGKAYLGGRMPSPDEVRAATAHWRGGANYAQELLLHAQHQKTL
ncbi:MAG TPA: hypothetical protein VFB15_00935 [Candidatus Binataceae bacterium]|nr:hypothetical protein [Candidatus Binataceae bacterium]